MWAGVVPEKCFPTPMDKVPLGKTRETPTSLGVVAWIGLMQKDKFSLSVPWTREGLTGFKQEKSGLI